MHIPRLFRLLVGPLSVLLAGTVGAQIQKPPVWFPEVLYVNGAATGANNGLSWTDAFVSLDSALNSAVTGQQIWVARWFGYKPTTLTIPSDPRSATFLVGPGIQVYGGFAGGEALLSQRDPTNPTIMQGQLAPTIAAYHVVTTWGQAVVDGFDIRFGDARSAPDPRGGGVYCKSVGAIVPDLSLYNCAVRANKAVQGAGLSVLAGKVRIRRCLFVVNDAQDVGGGLHGRTAEIQASNATFNDNTSQNNSGGAICLESIAALDKAVFVNSFFFGNHAPSFGAAVFLKSGTVDAGRATFSSCTFRENFGTTDGSALYGEPGPIPGSSEVENSIVWDNDSPEISGQHSITFSDLELVWPGAGNFSNDPLFVGPSGYQLQTTSPCFNVGNQSLLQLDLLDLDNDAITAEPVPVDLSNDRRVRHGQLDCGAFEIKL
jgi:predicted outer membrane repeat protein